MYTIRHLRISRLEAVVKICHFLSQLKDQVLHDEQTVSEVLLIYRTRGEQCRSFVRTVRKRVTANWDAWCMRLGHSQGTEKLAREGG
jgi:hypothetical protein